MAITAPTVGGLTVIQLGADGDSYANLLTFKGNNAAHFDADTNMPQVTRSNKPIYLPTGIHAEFDNAFLVLDDGSGIGVQTVGDGALRITNGIVVVNSDNGSAPPGVNLQRLAQFHPEGTQWDSIGKTEQAPLEIRNSTLIFTTDENGSNNALVLSYSVGDGLGGNRIIWDPSLSSTGDRLFIGASYEIRNTDIFLRRNKLVFNDIASDLGAVAFENVRLYGALPQIDQQGMTIYSGLRFVGRNNLDAAFTGYFGGTTVKRRAARVQQNMTPYIDGGIASSNTGFPSYNKDANKLGNSGLVGTPMPFSNLYRLRIVDQDTEAVVGAKICAFTKKSTGSAYVRETALNLGQALNGYAYGDSISDSDFADAGQRLQDRFANNHSLDGEDEYVTITGGIPAISGQTAESLLDLISVYTAANGTSAFSRINYDAPYCRVSKYGHHMEDRFDLTLGYDTATDASVREHQIRIPEDDAITETTKATVAAYTATGTLNKVYDYIRYLEDENRGDVNLDLIGMDGESIQFPDNSTLELDTGQAAPIVVTYASGGSTYSFKDEAITASAGKTKIDTGSGGSIADGIFADAVKLESSAGITMIINVSEGSDSVGDVEVLVRRAGVSDVSGQATRTAYSG